MSDFWIQIDNREKRPWTFESVRTSGRTVALTVARNRTADYTFRGGEQEIAIERKSLVDFLGTMGLAKDDANNRKRDRFESEIVRMQETRESYIIVEAPLSRVLACGHAIKGRIAKILLIRAILRFKRRYPRTRWIFVSCREEAEIIAWLLLFRAWKKLNRVHLAADQTDQEGPAGQADPRPA